VSDIPFRKDSDLKKIRNIIIGDDHDVVQELKERIVDQDKRSDDVAEILPRAIGKLESEQDQAELGKALAHPMETAVKLSIKSNPKTFSDLLYPVILPSIRRAVNEMLRSFVERIDRAISQRLSLKSLGWRLESLRTGIPYSEILLRHSILYSVEQALLVHRESGLLIQHAHTESAKQTDSDAVSGMLMAIENFVQDSFVENDELLQRVTIGEHIVYLIDGPYAMLACVVRGLPPSSFLEEMREILESIHAVEPDKLKNFSGDRSELNSLRPYMDKSLQVAYKEEDGSEKEQRSKKVITILSWLFGAVFLLLAGYWGYNRIQENRVKQYVMQLNQQPGIKILNQSKDKGIWHLDGLKDPAVAMPAFSQKSLFLQPNDIQLNLAAFQGMDESLILERATSFLALPDSISASLNGSVLKASGDAPAAWYLDTKERVSLPTGISQLDLTAISLNQEETMAFLHQVLRPPETVEVQSTANGISYTGIASLDWINSLKSLVEMFSDKLTINTSALQSSEENRLLTLMQKLGEKRIDFVDKTVMTISSEKTLLQVAMTLSEIERLAMPLEKHYQIIITGYTDETGTKALNQSLRMERAVFVMEKLKLYGVNHNRLIAVPEKNNRMKQRQAGFTARLVADANQN